MGRRIAFTIACVILVIGMGLAVRRLLLPHTDPQVQSVLPETPDMTSPSPYSVPPTPTPKPPDTFLIPMRTHVYQTFNNCGPASLSMVLSYVGYDKTQTEIGNTLRPYQNPNGDNDDKSVTLPELAAYAEQLGLVTFHRPNGSIDTMKRIIALGVPVLTRTWLTSGEDIGHYRVLRGYDDRESILIQDDSLQGKDLQYGYDEFRILWEPFNYEYLIVSPPEIADSVRNALGEDADSRTAWEKNFRQLSEQYSRNPDAVYLSFNLSVAAYHLGQYEDSIRYFEAVEHRLPPRTLWYQLEPILSYYESGRHDDTLQRINHILSHDNRAYSELYIIRGKIYRDRGETAKAIAEFESAIHYNTSLAEARTLLEQLR